MTGPLVLAPTRLEARALRRGSDRLAVLRTGTGPVRAAKAGREPRDGVVAVAGIGGGLAPGLAAGDVVVATEVRCADGPAITLPDPTTLATLLGQQGLTVHTGPVVSNRKIVHGSARDRLAASGASIVDTESWWLLRHRDPARCWCVRVVADAAPARVLSPRTLGAIRTALGVLPRVGAALGSLVNHDSTMREVRVDGGTAAASR